MKIGLGYTADTIKQWRKEPEMTQKEKDIRFWATIFAFSWTDKDEAVVVKVDPNTWECEILEQ